MGLIDTILAQTGLDYKPGDAGAAGECEMLPSQRLHYERIPQAFRGWPNFNLFAVIWNEEKGKYDKTPLIPNRKELDEKGWRALSSPTNPLTWGPYKETLSVWKEMTAEPLDDPKSFVAMGFALQKGAGFTVIDVDHCFDDDGDITSDIVKDFIREFRPYQSMVYMEKSCSGGGLHIFFRSDMFLNGNRPKLSGSVEIEIYRESRFITLTGDIFGEYGQIGDGNLGAEVKAILGKFGCADVMTESYTEKAKVVTQIDKEEPVILESGTKLTSKMVLAAIKKTVQAGKFKTLYEDGDISSYGDDHHCADLALTNILTFFTCKNYKLIDAMFRRSALMRDKWDEMRGTVTYGERTIGIAIESCEATWDYDWAAKKKAEKEAKKEKRKAENESRYSDVDKNQWHIIDPDTGAVKGYLESILAAHIISVLPILNVQGYLWTYTGHSWITEDAEHNIYDLISDCFYDVVNNSRNKESVMKYIKQMGCIKCKWSEMNAHPSHWIFFQDKIVDVKEKRFISHDKKYKNTIVLPYDCPIQDFSELDTAEWGRWMQKWFDDCIQKNEDIGVLQEFLGQCLTINNDFKTFLLLVGNSDSGKSVYMNILNALLQDGLSSATAPQDLSGQFAGYNLWAKVIDVCGDISSQNLENCSFLKRVTGRDGVNVEKKYGAVNELQLYCKFCFGANTAPQFRDGYDDSIYNRMIMIKFNTTIPRDKQINGYERLVIQEEKDSLLKMAMIGLKRLLDRGYYEQSETSKELKNELREETDYVFYYIRKGLVKKDGVKIAAKDVYKDFNDMCLDAGVRYPLGKIKFFKSLKEKGLIPSKIDGYDYFRGYCLNRRADWHTVAQTNTEALNKVNGSHGRVYDGIPDNPKPAEVIQLQFSSTDDPYADIILPG